MNNPVYSISSETLVGMTFEGKERNVKKTEIKKGFYLNDSPFCPAAKPILPNVHSQLQGMSDLLSPLLVVMRDEGQAYLSFCALMSRTAGNFRTDGKLMTTKFEHLSQSLLYYDPEFYAYLKLRHADDLLFCYRWLLLELKREFSFDDACLAIEVLWSSLPPPPQSLKSMANGGGVQLFEQRFQQPEDRNIKAMGGVDVYNIASSSTKTKFQPSSSLTGGSEGYFQGRKHNGRAGTAFSNIVSVRKRVSSDEEGLLHSISTNASVKGARSKTFVVRSRRIQSAGSAEEEIMKSKNNGEHNIHVSLDGKPKETSDSRSVLQSTSGDVDAVKEDSSKVQETNVGTESYTGDEDKSGEPKNSSLPRQLPCNRLPVPIEFGGGNPFLMFMCLACILKHRDCILEQQLDYQEIAMYFDKLTRRHNVRETLDLARTYFAQYLSDDWKREARNDIQEQCREFSDLGTLGRNSRKC